MCCHTGFEDTWDITAGGALFSALFQGFCIWNYCFSYLLRYGLGDVVTKFYLMLPSSSSVIQCLVFAPVFAVEIVRPGAAKAHALKINLYPFLISGGA